MNEKQNPTKKKQKVKKQFNIYKLFIDRASGCDWGTGS